MKQEQQPLKGVIKNVLIALVGTSPAVVTETINALVKPLGYGPEFKPDRVILITTSEGRARINDDLLDCALGKSRWAGFVDDMGLPKDLQPEIRVPVGHQVDLIDVDQSDIDAHSEPELNRMGELIFETVGEWTREHPNTTVCVSLSGGRKSMSHLAGTSLSLLGRAQDFLVHVIVKPESLEHCPGFYYIEPHTTRYEWDDSYSGTPTHHKVIKEEIALHLSRVPFVRLGNLPELRERIDTFAGWGLRATIDAASSNAAPKGKSLIYRKSQPKKLFLDGVDLTTFSRAEGKAVLRSPQKIVAILKVIQCRGALPTSPDEAAMFDLFSEWRRVERDAKVPFDAAEWAKRVGKYWKPRGGAFHIDEEELMNKALFAVKFHDYALGKNRFPFAGDVTSLREAIQRAPSVTALYDIRAPRTSVPGGYQLLNLEFKVEA